MKKILLILFCVSFQGIHAQQDEVKNAIISLFDGMQTQDTIKMKSVMSKDMVLHSVAEGPKGTKLMVDPAAEFVKSIATIPKDVKIEERILSYDIKIDGAMAHAWTPYEFYINGKLSHKGVNSFQLMKEADGWKIVYIIDTRRK